MLADRPYMRPGPLFVARSMTVILIIVNVGVHLIRALAGNSSGLAGWVNTHLALSLHGLAHGYVWQLLTFQFLHADILHLLVNCLALYFFGKAVEQALGTRTFTRLYFVAGLAGGLLQVLVNLMMHWVDPLAYVRPVVGASAGVFGVVTAFALMFPENQITLLLFFVVPVTLKAKYLLWGSAVLALVGVFSAFGGVAHAAHLGGMLAAYAYLRWGTQVEGLWLSRRLPRPRLRPRELIKIHSPKASGWSSLKPSPSDDLPADEFISREVDPILDKISAQGLHSLTPEERRILERARARMEKRTGGNPEG